MSAHEPQNQEIGQVLNLLCPMHAVIDASGHIAHAGATLAKLFAPGEVVGTRFLEAFEVCRPRPVTLMSDLLDLAGTKLHLRLRSGARTELKGLLVPLGKKQSFGPAGGAIINLSFGISVHEAVGDYGLTSADFAATDLAVEMMYLVEAKTAAMEASRKLNLRLQGAKIAAEEQAFTDTLTGLRNRRAMKHIVNRMIENGHDMAIMNLDLDFFKEVNDMYGHAAGDHVLQAVSRLLVNETRSDDIIIRLGGDEFVLIFAGLTEAERIPPIADRLIARLEEPIMFGDKECRISASMGVTLSCDYDRPSLDRMLDDADVALYEAKRRGRGQHALYESKLREAEGVVALPRRGRA